MLHGKTQEQNCNWQSTDKFFGVYILFLISCHITFIFYHFVVEEILTLIIRYKLMLIGNLIFRKTTYINNNKHLFLVLDTLY